MLLSFALLSAVFASEECNVCQSTLTQTVETYSTAKVGANNMIGSNVCFSANPGSTKQTCNIGCYTLFYGLQAVNVHGDKVETVSIERGCIYEKEDKDGVTYNFPGDFDSNTCGNTACEITLMEENYGNGGEINAYYLTTSQNQQINNFGDSYAEEDGLSCYQCESDTVERDNACYKNPTFKSQCPHVNATSCFSTVSNYEIYTEDGETINYQFARRGCSDTSSTYADEAEVITSDGPVWIIESKDDDELVSRQMETTYCSTKNCNDAKMETISGAATHQILAIVLMPIILTLL